MIKKVLSAAFFIVTALLSAHDFQQTFKVSEDREYLQEIPKSIIIKTKKFKVKIDRQPNGNYLYQSWGANTKISAKPSMIIPDGMVVRSGSGGNYYFEFNNEGTLYQVWRNYLTDSPKKAPYTLVVIDSKGNTLVYQDAAVVKN